MAGRRKKGEVETALVQRPVVDAEFVEQSETTALANAFVESQKTIKDLVALMKGSYADMSMSLKIMGDSFNESLRAQVEATKRERELLDQKEERRIKRDREKRDDEFKRTILGDLRVLLPQLLNRLGKGPVVSAPEAALLKPFVEGLSEKQIGHILAGLTESQQLALIEILKAIPDEPDGKIAQEKNNGAH